MTLRLRDRGRHDKNFLRWRLDLSLWGHQDVGEERLALKASPGGG